MFCMLKEKKIYPAYVSKHTSNCEKQVILFMISNEEKRWWHHLAVTKQWALLRVVTSKHHGDFYCLNCFHSFATGNKLQSDKIVCKNKDFCNIIMPSKDTKILEFNQYQKSEKAPFIIYAALESIIEKIDGCKIILKIHLQQKLANILHQFFQCLQYFGLEA